MRVTHHDALGVVLNGEALREASQYTVEGLSALINQRTGGAG
jgi:hypothetical protein